MRKPASVLARPLVERLDRTLGGGRRRQVVVTLALVLALDSADKATIGANATQLEAGLGIGTPQIGLLLTVSSLVGAVATLSAGALTDRVRRTRLLALAVAAWGVAMVLSGCAVDFTFLLCTRIGLGVVTAVAGPAVASLIGDYFSEQERGRIYGFVLSGELIGAAFGFVVAGQVAALSWRAPFFLLAAPTVLVWWLLRRLPEPERGGAGPGEDPVRMTMCQAVRYVLRVRTNVVLIVASALGYCFFSGMRGFALEFAKKHYGVGQALASALVVVLGIGALLGVLLGGRLADRMLRGGRSAARIEVPGIAVLLSAALFVPSLITTNLMLAVPLLAAAALCLGMANPPLDAARLDIVHPSLWGRAEAVRSVLRNVGDAGAPLVVGVLAQSVLGGGGSGLEYAFLIMLTALVAASAITLTIARRTYPGDVAAAAESLGVSPRGRSAPYRAE